MSVLNHSKLLRWLASPRLLFFVLPWLIALLIFGTIAQASIGLYDAERLYFASWWVWLGPIPLPGVYPTLALMTLSLTAKLILKSVWRAAFVGTLLTHGGVLVLLIGGLVTALTAEEGYIPIKEGASASRITDYHERRFAVYKTTSSRGLTAGSLPADSSRLRDPAVKPRDDKTQEILSIPHHTISKGDQFTDARLPFTITITDYFRHAIAKPREDDTECHPARVAGSPADCSKSKEMPQQVRHDTIYQGIAQQVTLEAGELMKEDEANHTGIVFDIAINTSFCDSQSECAESSSDNCYPAHVAGSPADCSQSEEMPPSFDGADSTVRHDTIFGTHLLFEPMPRYPTFNIDGATYEIRLGKIQRALPFSLTLNDFEKISYPGTMQAREYQSDITLNDGEINWRGLIAMNEPLRYRGYTFYQSSFLETPQGPVSVLAVVKNDGLIFPYVASALMTLGLIWHSALKMRWRKRA